ncbi:hypothetical protein P7C71_g1544, partial [Lecanoromycetidae sp. Uapishka_2]
MVHYLPPPDYRSLLPPLLACLPTAFVSPRPPPALLPLLSPILRQRVQLLAATATSTSDSWLPLLCWETEPAQKLVDLVSESNAFELHPVSGEIDFGDVEDLKYRRLDEESLQARIAIPDMGLLVVYLWCQGDQDGGGSGWRVSEVKALEGELDIAPQNWASTIGQADEEYQEKIMDQALQHGEDNSIPLASNNKDTANGGENNDDDDYWAQYDNTPGRTPAVKSPAPSSMLNRHTTAGTDADYYARYAQVQPEMDNDDPTENRNDLGESSLNGNIMTSSTRQPAQHDRFLAQDDSSLPNGSGAEPADLDLSHPTASSPRTRSTTISRLEDSAELQSVAEVAVKQHVSTSIKSLFRLCRSSGIERSDFDQMVKTELETLSMISEDD